MTRPQHEGALGGLLEVARRPLLAAAGLSFTVNLLLLVPALFMLQIFDRVLVSGSRETLVMLLIGAAAALGLMFVLDHLRGRLQGVAGNLVVDAIMPRVARHLLAARARSAQPVSGEPLRDVAVLRGLFSSQGLQALFDAPWVIFYVLIIALVHPWLGAAATVATLVMAGTAWLNDRLTRRSIEALRTAAGATQARLESSLAQAEVAQAMGMAPVLLERWQQRQAGMVALQTSVAQRSVALSAFARTLRQLIQVGMLSVGAYLVISQSASPGVMVATTILLARALAPVEQLVAGWKAIAEGRAALGRLTVLLQAEAAQPQPMQLPPPLGALQADALVWRPPARERPVLAGVSLRLEPGELLAVTGPSGAGKSTLLRVLAGLWPATSGAVRLDGADVHSWTREALGAHVGYVPQDVSLFDGTVAENIARMGTVDHEAVVAAAHAAGIHEMVLALPQGYDTPVAAGSALLSPGQRQRIALARALYGSPKLVLLDEPNANLDGAGELALGQALARLQGRCTVVMVTHRTTLLSHVDRLLVLEDGRIRHFGPVAEVMQALQQASAHVVPLARHAAKSESAR